MPGPDDKHSRFLHLERARPAEPEPADEGAADEVESRFDGVERPRVARAPVAPARTGAQLDRFGPEPEPTLELADTSERRPVNRCLRCGYENGLFATRCAGCATSLDTPEQHAYNEQLWSARQAEEARLAEAAAARRAAEDEARAEAARSRRAMAEAMAREVGEAERRRLGGQPQWRDRTGEPEDGDTDPSPLGQKLLRALPAAWQVPAALVLAALVLTLAGWGIAGGLRGAHGPALGLAIALAALFLVPSRPRDH